MAEGRYIEAGDIFVQPATKHHRPPEAYRNESNPRGAVFIANYSRFDDKDLSFRAGSELDIQKLRELFTQMGYMVIDPLMNETKANTLTALENFCNLDIHKNVDSMVAIFSSHGREDEFYTSDGEVIHYSEIYQKFSSRNCPALRDKPKAFYFEFCRSKKREKDRPVSSAYSTIERRSRKIESTFVFHATAEGRKAYRRENSGTVIFNQICLVFMDHAKDTEFNKLMKLVSRPIKDIQVTDLRQIGVTEEFYFNPPFHIERNSSSNATCDRSATDTGRLADDCVSGGELKSKDVYEMSSSLQGLVLIINNLEEPQSDISKLRDTFQQLGFSVLPPLLNGSRKDILKEIKSFSVENHHDAAIVVFYGYGFEDHIISSDKVIIRHKAIVEIFSDSNCPKLANKPKLFIFHTVYNENLIDSVFELAQNMSLLSFHDINDDSDESNTDCKDVTIFSVEVEEKYCERLSLFSEIFYQVLLAPQNCKKELSPLLRLITKRLYAMNKSAYHVIVTSIRFTKDFYFTLSCLDTDNVDSQTIIPRRTIESDLSRKLASQITKKRHSRSHSGMYEVKRKALIIGFTNYQDKTFPYCYFHRDEIATLETMASGLGFSKQTLRNLTHVQIISEIKKLSTSEDLQDTSLLMVMVVGFGSDVNHFYDVIGNKIPVMDILNSFTDDQCPRMKGKPKVFYFHMTKLDQWVDIPMANVDKNLHEALSVYLISSLMDENSVHPSEGLETLCKVVGEQAGKTDIESLMMEVEEELNVHHYGQFEKFIIRPIRISRDIYLI